LHGKRKIQSQYGREESIWRLELMNELVPFILTGKWRSKKMEIMVLLMWFVLEIRWKDIN